VLHGPAQRDEMVDVARRVLNARSVALPADTLIETFGDIARETRAFVEGAQPNRIPDSVLATVLFTDLVGSTERAAALADRPRRGAGLADREGSRRRLWLRFRRSRRAQAQGRSGHLARIRRRRRLRGSSTSPFRTLIESHHLRQEPAV